MNSKRFLTIAGISLALVLALGGGILLGSIGGNSVFAQGPTNNQFGFGPGRMMGGAVAGGQAYTGTMPCATGNGFGNGIGMMGGARGLGYDEVMLPSLAKALGLTTDQLQAEFKAGKTVADLATAKGISIDKLTADLLAAHKEYLQKLVADGKLTQAQADAMIDRMDDVDSHPCLTGDVTPGQGAFGANGARGGMMGGRGGMMGGFGVRGTSN